MEIEWLDDTFSMDLCPLASICAIRTVMPHASGGQKSAAGTLFRHPLACGTCPGTHGAAVRIVRLQLQAIKKSMSHISQGKTRSFSLGRARLSNRGSIVLSLN